MQPIIVCCCLFLVPLKLKPLRGSLESPVGKLQRRVHVHPVLAVLSAIEWERQLQGEAAGQQQHGLGARGTELQQTAVDETNSVRAADQQGIAPYKAEQ